MGKETINDRMEQIVDTQFGGNKAAFSKAIGVSPASMSSYLGNIRRSKPPIDMVAKIIGNLHVDPYWLLLGSKANSTTEIITGAGSQYNGANSHHNTLMGSADALLEKIDMLQKSIEDKNQIIMDKDKIISLLEGHNDNK